ncbi:MAG: hypothetical protein K6B44_12750 [Lachnospiraceae bacterium]|nr:hypothetical protein [Lachnospiraceae bacterium]
MTVDLKAGLHMVTLGYIKKERYTGSGGGLRYYIQKVKPAEGEEGEDMIEVCIWNEPFSFECTPEEEKHFRKYPLNEDGLSEALDYIMNICNNDDN